MKKKYLIKYISGYSISKLNEFEEICSSNDMVFNKGEFFIFNKKNNKTKKRGVK